MHVFTILGDKQEQFYISVHTTRRVGSTIDEFSAICTNRVESA